VATVVDMTRSAIVEVESRGDLALPPDRLRFIHEGKTGSLFGWCGWAAAALAGNDDAAQRFSMFGRRLGIAFQIKDDILDYDGTESVGKPLGVDILEQKITMPLLGAFQNVSKEEQERVRTMVKDIVGQPELRDEIVAFVKSNGGLEYSVRRLEEYVAAAVRALDVLPQSREKDFLVQLAHYTGKRNK
jgi:octaprenyl-diphosphate synthase